MARPKTGKKKQNLMLTVTPQTRAELAFLSAHHGESISALISTWAAKEVKAICKRTGAELPRAEQMTMDEIEGV